MAHPTGSASPAAASGGNGGGGGQHFAALSSDGGSAAAGSSGGGASQRAASAPANTDGGSSVTATVSASPSPPQSPTAAGASGGGGSGGRVSSSSAFISVGFTPAALIDSLRYPLLQERGERVGDATQQEALRAAFCLPPGQALLAHYLCGRRKPGGWDAGVVMQGQLLVFGGCLVFQSNLLGRVKYKTIWFENVVSMRKKKVLSLPNSILVRHDDAGSGFQREELFTSFRLSSRQQAFALMAQQWALANPERARACLSSTGTMPPFLGDLLGCIDPGSPLTLAGRCSSAGMGPGGPPPLPWAPVLPASALPAPAPDMRLVADVAVDCGDAREFAEIILSDGSGFFPAFLRQQGNTPLTQTPWLPAMPDAGAAASPVCGLPCGGLASRRLTYLYSPAGSGAYKSSCIQEQVYAAVAAPGGGTSLAFEYIQRMPDLPAGIGKAFHLACMWLVEPVPPSGGGGGGGGGSGAATPRRPPASAAVPAREAATPPRAAVAAAAAAAATAAVVAREAADAGTTPGDLLSLRVDVSSPAAAPAAPCSDDGTTESAHGDRGTPFAAATPPNGSITGEGGASPRTPVAAGTPRGLARWSQGLVGRPSSRQQGRRQQGKAGADSCDAPTPSGGLGSSWGSFLRLSGTGTGAAAAAEAAPQGDGSGGGRSPTIRHSPSWPRRRRAVESADGHALGGSSGSAPPLRAFASADGPLGGSLRQGSTTSSSAGDASRRGSDGTVPPALGLDPPPGQQKQPSGAASDGGPAPLPAPRSPLGVAATGPGPAATTPGAPSRLGAPPPAAAAHAGPATPRGPAPPGRCRWRIWIAVRRDRFHVAWPSIESGTYSATKESLAAAARAGACWVANPAARQTLQQALPSAALALAPRHRRGGSHGSAQGLKGLLHRRTGSHSSMASAGAAAGGGGALGRGSLLAHGSGRHHIERGGLVGTIALVVAAAAHAALAPFRWAGIAAGAAAGRLERLAAPSGALGVVVVLLLAIAAAQAVALWHVARQLDALLAATAAAQEQQAALARALLQSAAALPGVGLNGSAALQSALTAPELLSSGLDG